MAGSEKKPNSRDIIRRLLQAEERGPVRTDDTSITGFHGTSAERVGKVIYKGELTDPPIEKPKQSRNSTLIFPTGRLHAKAIEVGADKAADQLSRDQNKNRLDAIDQARRTAQIDAFLQFAGMVTELDEQVPYEHASRLLASLSPKAKRDERLAESLDFFRSRISRNQLGDSLRRATEYRGILLGLDTDRLNPDETEIHRAGSKRPGLYVKTKSGGIDFRAITGYEPLGPHERDFSRLLRKSIGK